MPGSERSILDSIPLHNYRICFRYGVEIRHSHTHQQSETLRFGITPVY